MAKFPPEHLEAARKNDTGENSKIFYEKFGDGFLSGVIDIDLVRKEFHEAIPPEDFPDQDFYGTMEVISINHYETGVYRLLEQDSTIEKIENFMEDTGQTAQEVGELLKGTNAKVLEKLDELIEQFKESGNEVSGQLSELLGQPQGKGFIDRLNSENTNDRKR